MTTHDHMAAKVRKLKETYPEAFCRLCLYRLQPGEKGAAAGYCPRHYPYGDADWYADPLIRP